MRIGLVIMGLGAAAWAQTKPAPPAEAPQRTIRDASPFKAKGEAAKGDAAPAERTRATGAGTLNSLDTSTENLNPIRDANLQRLLKDGCAPAVSARITELRARLGILTEKETGRPAQSAIALAADWYKAPPVSGAAPEAVNSTDLLESVLPAKAEAPAKKTSEPDLAALRSELDQLLAACPGAGKADTKK